jgi:hypothetical protein
VDRIRELVRSDVHALSDIERLMEAAHATGFRDQGMSSFRSFFCSSCTFIFLFFLLYCDWAYGLGLGQPLFAMEHALDNIDNRHLHKHITMHFKPDNMTIVGTLTSFSTTSFFLSFLVSFEFVPVSHLSGTGIEHSKMADVVEKLFSTIDNKNDYYYEELAALERLPTEAYTPQVLSEQDARKLTVVKVCSFFNISFRFVAMLIPVFVLL